MLGRLLTQVSTGSRRLARGSWYQFP